MTLALNDQLTAPDGSSFRRDDHPGRLPDRLIRQLRVSETLCQAGRPFDKFANKGILLYPGEGSLKNPPKGYNALRESEPRMEVVETLRGLAPDLIVSVWYRRLLGPELLALPRVAALNLHGSLLPAYRGRAPLNWVLVNGERRTGVTLHHMTVHADAGDVVAHRPSISCRREGSRS